MKKYVTPTHLFGFKKVTACFIVVKVATCRPNVVAVVACHSSGCSCHTYAYYGGRGGRPIPLSRVAIHNICLVLAFGVRGGHTYAQYGVHIYAQCGGRDSAACVQCGGLRRQLFIYASSWFPAQTAGFQADSWFPMQYALYRQPVIYADNWISLGQLVSYAGSWLSTYIAVV